MYRHDPADKVGIFIDGENIHYSAKHLSMRLDYLKMCERLADGRRLVRSHFYTAISHESAGKIDFVNFLKLNGFRVVTKEIRLPMEGENAPPRAVSKGNLDMLMALDVFELIDDLDTVIICTGDGDYVPLVEAVARRGKHVEVCALREMTSTDLISVSDEYVDLINIKDSCALDVPVESAPRDDSVPPAHVRNDPDRPLNYDQIEY
jgi:uncharacterized LabA/DUF88 family protein